jgi:uracil phosphoribosyltransferase/phosphoserine phosphatase/adenylylsulfate kinase-like enzyme
MTDMAGVVGDPRTKEFTASRDRSVSNGKSVVIGLYGISGSGKTYLLEQLKDKLPQEGFAFYDGSGMIAKTIPGGLEEFQRLDEREKIHWRQVAIDRIAHESAASGKAAIVAGHFMFWPEREEAGTPVYTQNDLDTFTHIVYLDVPAELIEQRRLGDTERCRPSTSITHLHRWKEEEKEQLRRLCRQHNILFSLVSPHASLLDEISIHIRDFQCHSEEYNLSQAEKVLDDALVASKGQLETVLVMDADRTLAAADTGALFWKRVSASGQLTGDISPLKTLFSSPLAYSYTAFRQAVLLYEETAHELEYDDICSDVASEVTMYPDFVSLLQRVAGQEHVRAVVVTCGLRRIWEKILEREGLAKRVKVIGGGRIADGYVVTAAVKAALVVRIREIHKLHVCAFGDSPLDLDMLAKADQAVVVVGEEQARSKTMDQASSQAIDNDGLRARQALLPSNVAPRLDTSRLPLINLAADDFVDSILGRHNQPANLRFQHATNESAANLIMTPMRDAKNSGPALREAHRRVGQYLAHKFLADTIGLEEYRIQHVQGGPAIGYRLLDEQRTSIVALMRGGEPMALGINDAFPLAMFIHAGQPADVKLHHLRGQLTLVLVDSVVNSGKTIVEFVRHVRSLHPTIRIVIVAGVVQAQAVSEAGLPQALAGHTGLSLVALRQSDNKFTGTGTTDTGNRLFNTTHLP